MCKKCFNISSTKMCVIAYSSTAQHIFCSFESKCYDLNICFHLYFDLFSPPEWVCSFYVNAHTTVHSLVPPGRAHSQSCTEGDRYRLVFPHCATSAIYSDRLILQSVLSGVNNCKLCHWSLQSAVGDKSAQSSLSLAIIFNPY